MKAIIAARREVEIATVMIRIPVRYGDDNMPYDFPLRNGDEWRAVVDIDTGKLHDWPKGKSATLSMGVCGGGAYSLYNKSGSKLAVIANHIPHGVIPGEGNNYIRLSIDGNGVILNWPQSPDVSEFFKD